MVCPGKDSEGNPVRATTIWPCLLRYPGSVVWWRVMLMLSGGGAYSANRRRTSRFSLMTLRADAISSVKSELNRMLSNVCVTRSSSPVFTLRCLSTSSGRMMPSDSPTATILTRVFIGNRVSTMVTEEPRKQSLLVRQLCFDFHIGFAERVPFQLLLQLRSVHFQTNCNRHKQCDTVHCR